MSTTVDWASRDANREFAFLAASGEPTGGEVTLRYPVGILGVNLEAEDAVFEITATVHHELGDPGLCGGGGEG